MERNIVIFIILFVGFVGTIAFYCLLSEFCLRLIRRVHADQQAAAAAAAAASSSA